MDVNDSHRELETQMTANGYAVMDDKTMPAIQNIVERALACQDIRESKAGGIPAYAAGVKSEALGGNCPVQGEGRFVSEDGKEFAYYFRARGSHWSVKVGDGADPVYPWTDSEPGSEIKWVIDGGYGTAYDAGWMPRAHAVSLINAAYQAWLAAGGGNAPEAIDLLPDFVPPQPIEND